MAGDLGEPPLLVAAPPGLNLDRAQAATRTLQRLPDEVLRAMAHGLRCHADELAPGALFRGHSAGGCAVGITLRELAPEAFAFGRVEFWVWHRWRRGVERDVAQRFPRLKHLQWHFDEAVAELTQGGVDPEPARTVGIWLAASAEAELSRRPASRSTPRPPRPPKRSLGRARTHRFQRNKTAAETEVPRWS